MNIQLEHDEFLKAKKTCNITLVLDNLQHLENIGSAFRLADAFCVKHIFILDDKSLFREDNAKQNYKKINKTARNCMNYISYEIMPTATFLEKAKRLKHKFIALEITSESVPLKGVKFDIEDELILVVGAENFGVSQQLLDLCNLSVHIPMFGNNSSLNVSSALAITLYEISSQL